MQYTMVDYDYFQTFAMNFLEGRAFAREFSSDATEACIINQTAANIMGLVVPIGAEVYFNHPAFEESFKKVKIIGVVDDFHYRPLHKKIGPFIFRMYKPWHAYIFLKIQPGDLRASLNHIEQVTKKFAPEYPFRYEFLNDRYNKIYSSEIRLGKVFNLFALLAILISCLGLFGLASYSIEQRTKEIGIRRVLGASISGIVTMLSREFSKWVILANLFAWPVAGYFMYKWLDNFAYRITLSWLTFIGAAALTLAISLFTICYQAYKSARSNPVEALRYE
jgi:putative ABC transport system permease protein